MLFLALFAFMPSLEEGKRREERGVSREIAEMVEKQGTELTRWELPECLGT